MEIEHLQLLLGRTRTRVQQDFQQWWSQQVTNTHTPRHTLMQMTALIACYSRSGPTLKKNKNQCQPPNFSGSLCLSLSPSLSRKSNQRLSRPKYHHHRLLTSGETGQDEGDPGRTLCCFLCWPMEDQLPICLKFFLCLFVVLCAGSPTPHGFPPPGPAPQPASCIASPQGAVTDSGVVSPAGSSNDRGGSDAGGWRYVERPVLVGNGHIRSSLQL